MKNKNNGFTLIEMIGIIILLAVIMIVVAPSMIRTLKNTNDKRFENFKENLKIAAENYVVDNKDISEVTLEELLEKKYIDEIPSIPKDDPMSNGGTITELSPDAYISISKTCQDCLYNYTLTYMDSDGTSIEVSL